MQTVTSSNENEEGYEQAPKQITEIHANAYQRIDAEVTRMTPDHKSIRHETYSSAKMRDIIVPFHEKAKMKASKVFDANAKRATDETKCRDPAF